MRHTLFILILATELLLLGTQAGYSQTDTFEIAGKIVYLKVQERSYGGDVWIANANGDNPRQLTTTGDCYNPRWSPNGTTVAYLRDRNIWIINIDDGNPQQLTTTEDCMNFSWSPDSTKIAYFRDNGSSYFAYLWCYDLTVRGARRVIPDLVEGGLQPPLWSPDGRWIAYLALYERQVGFEDEGEYEYEGDIGSNYESRLEICSPSGENRRTLFVYPGWLCGWISDYRLIIESSELTFLDISNPGVLESVYRSPESRIINVSNFLGNKELVFFEHEIGWEDKPIDLVVINVDSLELKRQVLTRSPNHSFHGACFLGDIRKFWIMEQNRNSAGFGTGPRLLTLVVNGEIIRRIEGCEVSWIPG